MKTNPLLEKHELPPFAQIQSNDIEPALDAVLAKNRQALEQLLQNKATLTWENFMLPQENIEDELHQVWSPVNHLNSVMNSEELRKVYNECLPKLSEYSTEIGHNVKLYEAYQALKQSSAYSQFDVAQKKVIDNALRNFKLSGIALNAKDKKQYKEFDLKLSSLTTKFEENILDSTHAWSLHITDKKELQGLPEHALQAAQEKAKEKSLEGYLLTLDFPSYYAIITYCDNASLREKVYQAYATRASEQFPVGPQYDNAPIMEEILDIRLKMARVLSFNHYAEESLATKMAKSCEQVLTFLQDLAKKCTSKAKQEFKELSEFSQKTLQAWDVAYYSEKYRQALFDFNEEELRPYFPLEKVLAGMFSIIQTLYGMSVEEVKDIEAWHKDVRCFTIKDSQQQTRGKLLIDLFARDKKRGGAWMDDCKNRRVLANGEIQTPIAYLTCNFSPPVSDKPSLLTHDEVITLFHETGHCLQHVLTQINYLDVAGIHGVEWDAVELPSQFFENFCWEEESLKLISGHYETNEPFPHELKEKILKAKNFQIGLHLIRQLIFALFDFQLHMQAVAPNTQQIQQQLNQIRDELSPFKTPNYNRFQHSFSHIFAGGYAAGYYSYLWAEVLAHDAFSKFKEEGILNEKTGRAFLTCILEKGGSKNAMELFVDFRGREPKVEAMLGSYGIDL
jgi:oligopeptidase A